MHKHMESDPFRNRGAVEQDSPEQQTNLDFAGQIGHRNTGPQISGNDTDFPEPGESPEHSGEAVMADEKSKKTEKDTDLDEVDQDPGQRQKENQNDEKDDPLAA